MKTLLLSVMLCSITILHFPSSPAKLHPPEPDVLPERTKISNLLGPIVVQNINSTQTTVFGNLSSNTPQVCNNTRQAQPSVSSTAGNAAVRVDQRYDSSVSKASVSNTAGGASVKADRRYGPAVPPPSDTLPDLQSLHSSIDTYFNAQTHLELLEFKDAKKGEWLKFLPNLGITYALDGQPRPSISFSSGILYQAKKAKQQRAAKRRQILEQHLQAAEQAKNQLADLIIQYELLQNEYRTQQELFAIETDLFRIKQDEYERQELAPSDYLQAKRTYLLQQQALEQKRHQLDRLISKIRIHCHY